MPVGNCKYSVIPLFNFTNISVFNYLFNQHPGRHHPTQCTGYYYSDNNRIGGGWGHLSIEKCLQCLVFSHSLDLNLKSQLKGCGIQFKLILPSGHVQLNDLSFTILVSASGTL